jgi:hypothetical protein
MSAYLIGDASGFPRYCVLETSTRAHSGNRINSSSSPEIESKRPCFQSALAASIRSFEDDTKFHHTARAIHRLAAEKHQPRRRQSPERQSCTWAEHHKLARLGRVTADLDRAFHEPGRTLLVGHVDRQARAGFKRDVGIEHLDESFCR